MGKKVRTELTFEDMQKIKANLQGLEARFDQVQKEREEKYSLTASRFQETLKPFYQKRQAQLSVSSDFWSNVFIGVSPDLIEFYSEDKEVLRYLTNFQVVDLDTEIRLEFSFKENPWFLNERLWADFTKMSEGEYEVRGTSGVEWKEGKDFTLEAKAQYADHEDLLEMPLPSLFCLFDRSNYQWEDLRAFLMEELWIDPFLFYEADETQLQKEDRLAEAKITQDEISKFLDLEQAEMSQIDEEIEAKKIPIYGERQKLIDLIPGFWGQVIQNHDHWCRISDTEVECLSFLKCITLSTNGGSTRVTADFEENPYFHNPHLYKEIQEEPFEIKAVSGIEWKTPELNFVEKNKQQAGTHAGEKRPREDGSEESFVAFFEDVSNEDLDDRITMDILEEEVWQDPFRLFEDRELEETDSEDGDGAIGF